MPEPMSARPEWTTPVAEVLDHGRLIGVDSSMWVYRAAPLTPVADAKDANRILEASTPLMRLTELLAPLANTAGKRRRLNQDSYREIHLLLLNIPAPFQPRRGLTNARMLEADYGDRFTVRRMLAVGVKLKPIMSRKGESAFHAALDSVTDTIVSGGVPLEDYEEDYAVIDRILQQSGMRELGHDEFGRDELALAMGWWNFGGTPDTPILIHADHLHVFRTISAAQTASRADASQCERWRIPDSYALTMASVATFDLPWVDAVSARAMWAIDLLGAGARAVSIRARVEPPSVTRQELARGRDRYRKDREERVAQGRLSKAEQDQQIQVLSEVEAAYATQGGTPTLVDLSAVVALDGAITDVGRALQDSAVNLGSLPFRQQSAFTEAMVCSHVRASPQRHDLPAQAVACSGLTNLSVVGDSDGALLGFTELDWQPAYVSPFAATTADGGPLLTVMGATGSGKSMALLALARQWASITTHYGTRTPIILVDPKQGSDFRDPVEKLGGQVMSLDDLASADGVFDPIRVLIDRSTPERELLTMGEAVELASNMISGIDPWRKNERQGYEVPLLAALRYGVEHGASCVGEALRMADAASPLPPGMLGPILGMLDASGLARTILGMNPGTVPLRSAEGLSLIMVGNTRIPLPDSGAGAWERASLVQRVGSWVLKMMVFGSAAAVAYREGVVVLDEAWQFLTGPDGAQEVQRLSRLARSQQVLVVLASQRVSDFIDAELIGGISRGIILPLDRGSGMVDRQGNKDDGQAGLALDLFQIARTEDRLRRLAAPRTVEGSDEPNWASMRALRDPSTGRVVRGTIGLYIDLSGRVVPTEIVVPPTFLAEISTTSTDVIARRAARDAGER